jgi:hypothetical protein
MSSYVIKDSAGLYLKGRKYPEWQADLQKARVFSRRCDASNSILYSNDLSIVAVVIAEVGDA